MSDPLFDALQRLTQVYVLPGTHPGLLERGNINLFNRPVAHNPGGSVSTVRSITVGLNDGRQLLLPTVVNGAVVSPQQAVAHYRSTGQHLGIFANNAAAERYANLLHQQQARLYP